MSASERVGAGVTKSTNIQSDGLHAFYAGGQTYTSSSGAGMLEMVTSEMLHWVTHRDGRRTLDACYDGTWLRSSDDNGATWTAASVSGWRMGWCWRPLRSTKGWMAGPGAPWSPCSKTTGPRSGRRPLPRPSTNPARPERRTGSPTSWTGRSSARRLAIRSSSPNSTRGPRGSQRAQSDSSRIGRTMRMKW